MAALIFNLIFTTISLFSNLIAFIFFKLISFVLVLAIQTFKISGEAVQGGLEQLGSVIKWVFGHVCELVLNSAWNLVLYLLGLAWNGAWGAVESAGLGVAGMVGMAMRARESINGMMESDPEIVNGLWGMVGSVGGGIWSNCVDAVKHVFENA